jgi:hypothetical protein
VLGGKGVSGYIIGTLDITTPEYYGSARSLAMTNYILDGVCFALLCPGWVLMEKPEKDRNKRDGPDRPIHPLPYVRICEVFMAD